ncbi:MAG: septal ring lytic transglycosylase RlpA family protein [Rhizobiaceae bacterium]|nr:septal ring lytic transglycosylase RlpA family protein [Rhizobiaceae bacterium]
MGNSTRSAPSRLSLAATLAVSVFAAGCSSTSTPTVSSSGRESAGKEYFSEAEYGVKASPRVSNLRTRLPRGGGRDMLGKPYKVKGKWYKPKEDRNYSKVGAASWYGDAFHGRLTANGEIYDMTHLTAAHPTMPLPSYARVTNTANGASVIVRVNDRGPYAHNRVIDLSKRAAELLDYKHVGVARVKVEYVGRAPLHGRDDNYLLASYHPGKSGIDRPRPGNDGLPAGVMVAMNGDTPTTKKRGGLFAGFGKEARPVAPAPVVAPVSVVAAAPVAAPVAIAGVSGVVAAGALAPISAPAEAWGEVLASDPVLPEFGPMVPERPYDGLAPVMVASAKLSYADERVAAASAAFNSLAVPGFDADDVRASWKRLNGETQAAQEAPAELYVLAGSYSSRAEADKVAAVLRGIGAVAVKADGDAFNVELRGDGRNAPDIMAELAREGGAPDAFLIRD